MQAMYSVIVHHNEYNRLNDSKHNDIISFYDNLYPEYKDDTFPHYLDFFYKKWCGHIDEKIRGNL